MGQGCAPRAVLRGCPNSIANLRTVATIKAKKAEAAQLSSKIHDWKVCIGAKTARAGEVPRPTRLAFRWVKGLTGWQKSPIGPASANHSVPAEGEKANDDGNNGEEEDELESLPNI